MTEKPRYTMDGNRKDATDGVGGFASFAERALKGDGK